jgi:hypothetical protein
MVVSWALFWFGQVETDWDNSACWMARMESRGSKCDCCERERTWHQVRSQDCPKQVNNFNLSTRPRDGIDPTSVSKLFVSPGGHIKNFDGHDIALVIINMAFPDKYSGLSI